MALLRHGQPARLPPVAADVEDRIRADPEWQRGAAFHGHPGETVAAHVEDVLRNVEREPEPLRERLRLIALVHDSMKHRVRWWRPDHARLAARFARAYTDDTGVLKVIRHHDDAYRAWRLGRRTGRWRLAQWRARRLIARLGDDLELFRAFYRADNATADKACDDREWFDALVENR